MCAMLQGQAAAALTHFKQAGDYYTLSPEASLLFARAQLSTNDRKDRENAQNRLLHLQSDLERTNNTVSDVGLMSSFLLCIAAMYQGNLFEANDTLMHLVDQLKSNPQQLPMFTEKMRYFITNEEINTFSETYPTLNKRLCLKAIGNMLPKLGLFSPPKTLPFSSFCIENDRDIPPFSLAPQSPGW